MEDIAFSVPVPPRLEAIHSEVEFEVRWVTTGEEIADVKISYPKMKPSSLAYIHAEFPSQFTSSTITHSLGNCFDALLAKDARIRQIYWAFENLVLRIWTILEEPDIEIERPIYEAQRRFMRSFRDLDCDFSVIYAFGKDLNNIHPEGAIAVR